MSETVSFDEERTVAQLKKGSEAALVAVIRQYTPYVSAVIYHVAGERLSGQDAEELLSDVFLALWDNAKKLRPGKLRAYLGTLARNKTKNALRRRGEVLSLEEDVIPVSPSDPEGECVRAEDGKLLRRALNAMPEPDRTIFIRRYWYCQTVPAIARQLDMNVNTVQTKLSRGRDRLRLALQEGGYILE